MKKGRFEIGDMVVGNSKASRRYSITTEGWIGTVIKASKYSIEDERSDDITVEADGSTFAVNHACFDLYKEVTDSVIIKGFAMPECCGECFAYDAVGCRLNADVALENVWKTRATKCPLCKGRIIPNTEEK